MTAAARRFALFSSVAEAVELCLFDESGEETRWSLDQGDAVRVAGLPAGGAAGSALRLSRARSVGPVVGRPLQPGQAAAGPLRACHCR